MGKGSDSRGNAPSRPAVGVGADVLRGVREWIPFASLNDLKDLATLLQKELHPRGYTLIIVHMSPEDERLAAR